MVEVGEVVVTAVEVVEVDVDVEEDEDEGEEEEAAVDELDEAELDAVSAFPKLIGELGFESDT